MFSLTLIPAQNQCLAAGGDSGSRLGGHHFLDPLKRTERIVFNHSYKSYPHLVQRRSSLQVQRESVLALFQPLLHPRKYGISRGGV